MYIIFVCSGFRVSVAQGSPWHSPLWKGLCLLHNFCAFYNNIIFTSSFPCLKFISECLLGFSLFFGKVWININLSFASLSLFMVLELLITSHFIFTVLILSLSNLAFSPCAGLVFPSLTGSVMSSS